MDLIQRIKTFNTGREYASLQEKYKRMRSSAFRFYRGTCHLFYEDNHSLPLLNDSPTAWCCGDAHIENFGAYKGDDRDVYFDINDFDEAMLAPCLWELSRFICSIILAHDMTGVSESESLALTSDVLMHYDHTILRGQTAKLDVTKAEGVIHDLLLPVIERKRKAFIEKRTVTENGKRKLLIDDVHVFAISDEEKQKVSATIKNWAADKQNKSFYEVLDVAFRIAGTGSLGIKRYAILVRGKDEPGKNYILDMKYALPSSLQPYLKIPQPTWQNDAQRVTHIQKLMQATPPALLNRIQMDDQWYVIRELQPVSDKLNIIALNGNYKGLDKSLDNFGRIMAWDQIRSSNNEGSANVGDLINFVQRNGWHKPLLDFCYVYANKVKSDYTEFAQAYDKGLFV